MTRISILHRRGPMWLANSESCVFFVRLPLGAHAWSCTNKHLDHSCFSLFRYQLATATTPTNVAILPTVFTLSHASSDMLEGLRAFHHDMTGTRRSVAR